MHLSLNTLRGGTLWDRVGGSYTQCLLGLVCDLAGRARLTCRLKNTNALALVQLRDDLVNGVLVGVVEDLIRTKVFDVLSVAGRAGRDNLKAGRLVELDRIAADT